MKSSTEHCVFECEENLDEARSLIKDINLKDMSAGEENFMGQLRNARQKLNRVSRLVEESCKYETACIRLQAAGMVNNRTHFHQLAKDIRDSEQDILETGRC